MKTLQVGVVCFLLHSFSLLSQSLLGIVLMRHQCVHHLERETKRIEAENIDLFHSIHNHNQYTRDTVKCSE